MLLTSGYKEKRPLDSYKKLLKSSLPQSSGVSPGSSEISKYSRRYWLNHVQTGARLPYFEAFDINEVNIFANLCECDFVFYRHFGKKNQQESKNQLVVVADTRLFSTNHTKPGLRCVHVLLSNDGAKKIPKRVIVQARIKQMLPNASAKDVVAFDSPLECLKRAGASCDEQTLEKLEQATFLDLRSDIRLLNLFSRALSRPVRLIAANCTSRFRRVENRPPRAVKTNTIEQRMSISGGDSTEPIVLCLQARTNKDGGLAVDALLNVDPSVCGPRQVGRTPGATAVSGKQVLAEAMNYFGEKKQKEKKQKEKEKGDCFTSHARRDPCCKKGSSDLCEACVQLQEEFAESKKPPIESSRKMYNPKKTAGSFLAEARSLGLCELFPWLEEAVIKMNLMSCSAIDIETLNVPVAPTTAESGGQAVLAGADEISGGRSVLTKHVPFVIGTTSFKVKAVKKWQASELVWRLQGEAGRYVEFRVDERSAVPSQSDVSKCVRDWLTYIERRRIIVSQQKRKILEPVITMLRDMAARSDEFQAEEDNDEEEENKPNFGFSVFGKLLRRLEQYCEEIWIVSYNGSKFDLIHLLSPLLIAAKKKGMQVKINRKG